MVEKTKKKNKKKAKGKNQDKKPQQESLEVTRSPEKKENLKNIQRESKIVEKKKYKSKSKEKHV